MPSVIAILQNVVLIYLKKYNTFQKCL